MARQFMSEIFEDMLAELYKSNGNYVVPYSLELRELPNGVKDTIDYLGNVTRNVSNLVVLNLEWFRRFVVDTNGYDLYRCDNLFTDLGLPGPNWGISEQKSILKIDGSALEFVSGFWGSLTGVGQYVQFNPVEGKGLDLLIPTGVLFTEFYSGKKIELIYELATPTSEQLTPSYQSTEGYTETGVVISKKLKYKFFVYGNIMFGFNVKRSNGTDNACEYQVLKNGIEILSGTITADADVNQIAGDIIDVDKGDYLEVGIKSGGTATVTLSDFKVFSEYGDEQKGYVTVF